MTAPDLKLPRPHGNRLLVFVPPTSGIVERGSGIAVVQSATEAPLVGHVLAVGPDVKKFSEFGEIGIRAHNQVLFSKYAGITVEIGGREYHVLDETDVLLVWPETFPLPAELEVPVVATEQLREDGPCTCDPIEIGESCGSSSCINLGGVASVPSDDISPLMDDATRPVELILP